MWFLLWMACEPFPRDGEGTLERVRDGTLRAGNLGEAPWAEVEAQAVEELAETLGAEVEWTTDGDLLADLEDGHLDLVVGGLTEDTPWKERVGLTRPWLKGAPGKKDSRHVFAVRPGEHAWLVEVERWLDGHRERMKEQLD
jgi:polar amino acid transport system substrate-binding protein